MSASPGRPSEGGDALKRTRFQQKSHGATDPFDALNAMPVLTPASPNKGVAKSKGRNSKVVEETRQPPGQKSTGTVCV